MIEQNLDLIIGTLQVRYYRAIFFPLHLFILENFMEPNIVCKFIVATILRFFPQFHKG